jgi:CheY-like chemotaxis protein
MPNTAKTSYNLDGLRVLVVEDFPFMAELMTSMLREFNVGKVLSTCSVLEAQRVLEMHNIQTPSSQHIDLIVTDLFPPRNEGLALTQWIRAHTSYDIKFLPVLFCTAHTSLRIVLSGRDLGATEILVKPLSAVKLAQRLLHMIDHPRPFVKAPRFFGPDRRRKHERRAGPERRTQRAAQMSADD